MSRQGIPPSTVGGSDLVGYRTGLRNHRRVAANGAQPRRFALEPLRRELAHQVGDHVGLATLAGALGVHPRQIHRWQHGGLTEAQADELAARLGRHPVEVWPDWYDVTAPGRGLQPAA